MFKLGFYKPSDRAMEVFNKEIRKVVDEFKAVQEKWISVGASDTEPDMAFQGYVFDVAHKDGGRSIDDLPTQADWYVFDDVEGVKDAVKELNAAAKKVAEKVCIFRDAAAKVAHSDIFWRL